MYQRTLGKAHFWLSMVGTNLTFFAMLALGYLGMPRRYATYQFDGAIAPLAQVSTFHLLATVGAFILLVGQLIFVWNIVQSWLEGPKVEDGDPWNLERDDMLDREFQWFDRKLETAITDGGEDDEDSVLPDGGQPESDG
jgi:cytochrome c oxidase subunit 1